MDGSKRSFVTEFGAPAPTQPYVGGPLRNGFFCPELLAPAGDWDCAKAAVENGADAIYFGLERFNARMRADNFTETDLPKLMEFLHRRGVRGYVTFNTLVFANELAEAEEYVRMLVSAGVDAALVQDVGICRLIRKISPDFPIHASTQMTVSSAGGVEFAKKLGCNLVVLARECSAKDLAKITRGSDAPEGSPALTDPRLSTLPIEVFIHGALCVAYSGQCLTSESLGGRSANRGECAQACRMPFSLVADGKQVPLGDRQYLLSPQDLAGLEMLPELIRAGASSLKIEGRLKSAEYVANITRIYRQALDRIFSAMTAGNGGQRSVVAGPQLEELVKLIRKEFAYDLEMAFSRGLYTGWLRGMNHQQLVHGRFGKKRGVFLGAVRRVERERVVVRLQSALKPGDGIVFDAGHPDQKEEGGRVYFVDKVGQSSAGRHSGSAPEFALSFGQGDIDFKRVHPGDKLWKTGDPQLDRRLRQTFSGEAPNFQRPVDVEVRGATGQPLTLVVRDESGRVTELKSTMPLAVAEKQPLTTERLREQFGRLGGTPFKLGRFDNRLEGSVILPMSEMNRLRREAVSKLEGLWAQPRRWTMTDFRLLAVQSGSENSQGKEVSQADTPNLVVLVREMAQLETALSCGCKLVYCDFDDPRKYRDAVALVRSGTQGADAPQIFVAPPRIFKPSEEWVLKQVRSCDADGYLVRNFDHLAFFAADKKIGDFSLNVANPLTAQYFKNEFGLERLTASYDLNIEQLDSLVRSAPASWFEVTIHQHMPMFHMDHCIFCAFLSPGTDFTNCGRPCDKHVVKLRDRVGMEHPLKADAGCRNTLFNARAQTGAEYVSRLAALGVRHFRIEMADETPEQVRRIIGEYSALLRGEMSGTDLWRKLKLQNRLGVTRGPMEKAEPTL